jgi:hypothetical protein
VKATQAMGQSCTRQVLLGVLPTSAPGVVPEARATWGCPMKRAFQAAVCVFEHMCGLNACEKM